jgi:sec-independent protein translocase protein TatB
MLDLGFFEIVIIGVVAVLILGPEKLPEALANVMKFLKKIKNFISETQKSIEKELEIEDLKKEANQYKEELLLNKQKLEELTNREIATPINEQIGDMKKIENETKREVTLKKGSAKSELQNLLKKRDEK